MASTQARPGLARPGRGGDRREVERLDHWGPVVGAQLIRRAALLSEAAGEVVDEDHQLAAALAGIAAVTAADAVCCIRLGRRSSGRAHRDVTRLFAQAEPEAGREHAMLDSLVRMRETTSRRHFLTEGEARRAVLHASAVVGYAERLAFGPSALS